jgi:hypothetical protein
LQGLVLSVVALLPAFVKLRNVVIELEAKSAE